MKKSANWWLVMRKNKPQKLFRIMKLIFFMCVCFVTSVSAEVLAQQRITMRLGETGLKMIFKEISRQTSKTIIYNDDQLALDRKVKADFIDVELEKVLQEVLKDQGMDYKFMDDTNWNEAVSNSPDPDWQPRPHDKEEYWRVVENFMNIEKRYADVQ